MCMIDIPKELWCLSLSIHVCMVTSLKENPLKTSGSFKTLPLKMGWNTRSPLIEISETILSPFRNQSPVY